MIGHYVSLLYALQLEDELLLIAQEDKLGRTPQDLKHRQRASKKKMDISTTIPIKVRNPQKKLLFRYLYQYQTHPLISPK